MECINHPETPTDRTCYQCGKPFCLDCFSKVDRRFCLSCYRDLYGKLECETANQALIFALLGLLCFGVVLEPLALFLSLDAKRVIQANPKMSGLGKANAALGIAIISLVLYGCILIMFVLK